MGTKDRLIEALSFTLEPGETIQTWRPVVTNGKVAESTYQTTLALLGPSAYCAATRGAVASVGEMPSRTNLVVVTDRRVLWCNKTPMCFRHRFATTSHWGEMCQTRLCGTRSVWSTWPITCVNYPTR